MRPMRAGVEHSTHQPLYNLKYPLQLLQLLAFIAPAIAQQPPPPCEQPLNVHHDNPTTGLLYSPNWPDPYPGRVNCVYNLSTSTSNVIHLVFQQFDVSPRSPRSGQCLDAYLLLIVIDRQGRQHIGERICGGDQFDRIFETMQSNIILEFNSYSNAVRTGFKIEYQFISEGSIRQPPSFYYDADRTYEARCGGRNEAGALWDEVVSPGFPLSYPKNISCSWLIRVEPHQRIYVRLLHLNITDIKECDFGALWIADGFRHDSATHRWEERRLEHSEVKFCGNVKFYEEEGLRSYISAGNRLLIRFQTGARTPLRGSEEWKVGFKLIWTAINGIIDEAVLAEPGARKETCDGGFTCHGGLLCTDQGLGICSPRQQFCIDPSLVCNGVPNCAEGDFSDEFHCHSTEIFVTGGVAFCVLLLVIVGALCCERTRRKSALRKALEADRPSSSKNGRPVWEDRRPRVPPR